MNCQPHWSVGKEAALLVGQLVVSAIIRVPSAGAPMDASADIPAYLWICRLNFTAQCISRRRRNFSHCHGVLCACSCRSCFGLNSEPRLGLRIGFNLLLGSLFGYGLRRWRFIYCSGLSWGYARVCKQKLETAHRCRAPVFANISDIVILQPPT